MHITPDRDELDQLMQALQRSLEKVRNLEAALEHSRDIGAAVGILMAMYKLSRDEAFEMLRRTSQDSNTKVRDLALDVIEQGCLPLPAGTRAFRGAVEQDV
jgi:AmiR/NasT family two-component response regulator